MAGKNTGPDPLFGETMKHKLIVVITKEMSEHFKKVAKENRKTVSTWARDVLLAAAPTKKTR